MIASRASPCGSTSRRSVKVSRCPLTSRKDKVTKDEQSDEQKTKKRRRANDNLLTRKRRKCPLIMSPVFCLTGQGVPVDSLRASAAHGWQVVRCPGARCPGRGCAGGVASGCPLSPVGASGVPVSSQGRQGGKVSRCPLWASRGQGRAAHGVRCGVSGGQVRQGKRHAGRPARPRRARRSLRRLKGWCGVIDIGGDSKCSLLIYPDTSWALKSFFSRAFGAHGRPFGLCGGRLPGLLALFRPQHGRFGA